jgi:hypothetical protein
MASRRYAKGSLGAPSPFSRAHWRLKRTPGRMAPAADLTLSTRARKLCRPAPTARPTEALLPATPCERPKELIVALGILIDKRRLEDGEVTSRHDQTVSAPIDRELGLLAD